MHASRLKIFSFDIKNEYGMRNPLSDSYFGINQNKDVGTPVSGGVVVLLMCVTQKRRHVAAAPKNNIFVQFSLHNTELSV